MRIAVATENGKVAAHFGRCPAYTIVDLVEGELKDRHVVENPGHAPGVIPQFLHEMDVSVIIAGGMGQRAQALFEEMGIKPVIGATGTVEEILTSCVLGTLEGGESLCTHGEGHGDGHGPGIENDEGYQHGEEHGGCSHS
jgi:predicted Fe-Mo cluster-binding NifX family protein